MSGIYVRPDELEILKPWIKSTVKSILGWEEDTVTSIAVDSIERKLSKDEMKAQLGILEDSAGKFVDMLYEQIPKAQEARKASKRKMEEDDQRAKEKKQKTDSYSSSSRDRDRDRDRSSRHRSDDRDRDRDRDRERDRDGRDKRDRESDRDRDRSSRSHRDSDSHSSRDKERDDKDRKDREKRSDRRESSSSSSSKASSSSDSSRRESSKTSESKKTSTSEVPAVTIKTEPLDTSSTTTSTPSAPAALTDLSALLKDLAAKKEALQSNLLAQKKENKSNELLSRNLSVKQKTQALEESKEERLRRATEKLESKLSKLPLPQLESRSSSTKTAPRESTDNRFVPPPLLLDQKGREIDSQGNIVSKPVENPTTISILKANKKRQSMGLSSNPQQEASNKKLYFDPNLAQPKTDRPKKSFTFLQAGSIVRKAEKLRAKAKGVATNENKVVETVVSTTAPDGTVVTKKVIREPVPDVEWWDKFLLVDDSTYGDADRAIKVDEITIYVEHPILLKPPGEKDEAPPIPMFLTKTEQKKLRRRTRAERQKEQQENVLLGLVEPPKPKVRIANLPTVLGAQASADPTQIEQEVRRQMAERVANHDARNQEQKLTKEERKEKKRGKMERDIKKGVHVALFRVNDVSDPRNKFKVDVNARDLSISGCVVLYKNMNLIIAEGGEKAIRKFIKLLTKRIDWTKTTEDDEDANAEKTENGKGEEKPEISKKDLSHNQCKLVWTGTALKTNFQQFRFESFPDEEAIRKYLNHRWSEHYWDLCKNYKEGDLVV